MMVLEMAVFFIAASAQAAPPVVTLSTPSVAAVVAGRQGEAKLTFTVAPGFHIQANPASKENLIPAKLDLKTAGGIRPGKPKYPPSKPYRLKGAQEDLATYEGTFTIALPLRADASANPGRRDLAGSFRYQACDARRCLFPVTMKVGLPVDVVAAPKKEQ